jgi:glyoxylase-like metal-dependent hydrolase (beta-lactamase superfamily II)
MRISTFALGPLETNCYVLDHAGRAVAVDPGGDPAEVLGFLRGEGVALEAILVTHLHFDHIYGCAALAAATGAPVWTPAADAYLMDSELGRGGLFGTPLVPPFESSAIGAGARTFLGLECRVLATPGHSPGSLTYYFPAAGAAFVGDVVFYRSVGRTDFPGGDAETLTRAVKEQIFTLPGATVLYPGHGMETTVDSERTHNPFFLHEML